MTKPEIKIAILKRNILKGIPAPVPASVLGEILIPEKGSDNKEKAHTISPIKLSTPAIEITGNLNRCPLTGDNANNSFLR